MDLTITVPDNQVEDLRSSCDSSYWAEIEFDADLCLVRDRQDGRARPGKWVPLNKTNVAAGLELMAEKYPRHFANFISGNFDAGTGDVWLQCAVLGEVIYG